MRTLILFLLLLLILPPSFAQKSLYQKKFSIGSQPVVEMEALVFDREDNMYLLDRSRVLKMKDGEVILELKLKQEEYTSTNPNVTYTGILADMTVDHHQNIFIINNWKRLIEKYDKSGKLLWTRPAPADQTTLTSYSRKLLVDSKNNLAIFDYLDAKIYYYTTDGVLLKTIDTPWLDPYSAPTGARVAFDANDNIYFVETINSTWNATLNFRVFNPDGKLIREFRAEKLKKEGLTGAQTMRFDHNGNLHFYSFRSPVYVVNTDGELIRKFTPAHQTYSPYSHGRVYIGFDSKHNLYLGNYYEYGSYILKYNAAYQLQEQIGNLRRPREVVFDKSNNLYILDDFTNKVVKTSLDGKVLLEFAGKSSGVVYPVAIAVDEQDNFYILEAGSNEGIIKKYDATGKAVAYMYGIEGQFSYDIRSTKAGLAIDKNGDMYVSNYFDHSLKKYSPAGKLIASFGAAGKAKGQIWRPIDVTVDASGNVFVLDMRGGRIQQFSPRGSFIQQFGEFDANKPDWDIRGRISSDAFGNLIVGGYKSEQKVALFDTRGILTEHLPTGTPGVAMSRDGTYLATADLNKDVITIYEITSPRAYNFIEGNIFRNEEGDCQPGPDATGLSDILVKAEPGPYYGVTDALGNFRLQVGKGTYTVTPLYENKHGRAISQTCVAGAIAKGVTFDSYGNYSTGSAIGVKVTLAPYLSVSLSSTRRRRCFESTTTVSYVNSGFATAPNAKVYVKLPAEVGLLSADKPYTRLPDGTYEFAVGDLTAGQRGTITIQDIVTCGDESVRGRTVCTRAWITPSNNTPTKPTPTVTITGRCDSQRGSIRFVIKNTGTADMEQHELFRKYANGELAGIEQFRLAAGDSLVLWVPSVGYTWRLEADQPEGNGDNKTASVTIEPCNGVVADTTITSSFVNLLPADDEEAEVSEECMMITDSYDPNDKLVTPVGRTDQFYTPTNTALKYKIRFQNTGTDVAYRVVVVDTLSEHLDLSTLQVGAASHAHRFEVSGKGQPVLTWTFDNIMLPDSTADEPGSHGYIQFSIMPKADLPEKTAVENFADIFFDFNSPIRTNVTVNRIYDMPPVVNETVRVNLEDVIATPAVAAFEPVAGKFGAPITITGKRFAATASDNKVYLNGKAATVVSASPTELRVLVPAGASTGKLQVVTPDGGVTAEEAFEVYQPPVLSAFSPAEGMVGQTVTLQGQHLQAELIEGVKLGQLNCEILNHNGNAVTVQVPAGASTGRFEVITKGGEAVSSAAYVVWYRPAISSLSKQTDIVGATITIAGEHFAADKARNQVFFGQVQAQILEATQQQLVVRVPEQAESGLITVETPGGKVSSAAIFEVIPGPRFKAMQPAQGSVGTVVEISGQHFGIMGLQDRIAFNGLEALVLEASGDRYKVRVPRGATTGKVQITGYGGKALSTADFVVEELTPAEAIQVYPNPNSGQFTISLQHADFDVQSVEIFDAVGKLIHTTTVDGPRPERLEMQLKSARPGLYTLHIKSDRGTIIKKVSIRN